MQWQSCFGEGLAPEPPALPPAAELADLPLQLSVRNLRDAVAAGQQSCFEVEDAGPTGSALAKGAGRVNVSVATASGAAPATTIASFGEYLQVHMPAMTSTISCMPIYDIFRAPCWPQAY